MGMDSLKKLVDVVFYDAVLEACLYNFLNSPWFSFIKVCDCVNLGIQKQIDGLAQNSVANYCSEGPGAIM